MCAHTVIIICYISTYVYQLVCRRHFIRQDEGWFIASHFCILHCLLCCKNSKQITGEKVSLGFNSFSKMNAWFHSPCHKDRELPFLPIKRDFLQQSILLKLCCMDYTALKERATGEKGPATKLEHGIYACLLACFWAPAAGVSARPVLVQKESFAPSISSHCLFYGEDSHE